jgi:glycosyltransferase involved in cell wall biosynthesis
MAEGDSARRATPSAAQASESARLRALADCLRLSAALHASRAAAAQRDASGRAGGVGAVLLRRITFPLRLTVDLFRGRLDRHQPTLRLIRRGWQVAATEGWGAGARKAAGYLWRHRGGTARAAPAVTRSHAVAWDRAYARPIASPAARILIPRVALIAELSLPQCAHYRVWHKRAHLRRLDVACQVVDWHDIQAARSALQLATMAIFYRVPGYPDVLALIAECRRLGVPSWWEVDDLIFDAEAYRRNSNLATLDPELRRGVLAGIPLYRAALLACDRAIASTAPLAAAMRRIGQRDVTIIENSLDQETLALAETLRTRARDDGGEVVVTYGSGSKAHDADFACAADALAALLRQRPRVRLRLVGDLAVPAALAGFGARVERLPTMQYRRYLELLARSDIAIVPLEDTDFNDAKSLVKYLEAAILAVPSVCSPRAPFRAAIADGTSGLLADDTDAWLSALLRLTDDPTLRVRMGQAALDSVLRHYGADTVGREQVAPLVRQAAPPSRKALRVLVVNIFFSPRSYGGATVVAEQVAHALHARPDTEVFVFTSAERGGDAPGTLVRYDLDGLPVIGIKLCDPDQILDFDNPEVGGVFEQVLDAVRPDIVHFHSVQGLSASMTLTCRLRQVPYVVTLHDAWWLCPRQFMVTGDGQYCFQTRIDLTICAACAPHIAHLPERMSLLLESLRGAACLLAPSEAHRALYLANGLSPDAILVSPNGIRRPRGARCRPSGGKVRFGYVGGEAAIKGFPLIRRAFHALERDNYLLLLVDQTLNLGYASMSTAGWRVKGEVRIVPAYTQDTMDEFFDSIDVLLFPSQWKESSGLTVREALARDVWVIATAGGGPAEAITDGVNGTLIPLDGRHEALLAAIEATLAEPERWPGYANPLKHQIIDFAQQATLVHAVLAAHVTDSGSAVPVSL